MEAIREGSVVPEGVDLICLTLPSGREVFDRMVGGREFDVAELSASEFISLAGAGDCPFVALPVFPSRVFRHGYIFINARSGIRTPKELAGKRVGLPLYTQTAAIWVRGHLRHQFGVDLAAIRWVQGAVEQAGTHGKPHAPPLLRPVALEQNESGEPLATLLARGEIDALIGSRKPETFGRHPDVARLFPDHRALERELYQNSKIFPIMHLIAMRRDQVCAHVAGMAGGVADALDAADGGEPRDEASQRPGAAVGSQPVIGIDVLAQQRDLAHALVGEAAGLGFHIGDGAGELGAARVGHDAEGAELVATLLHRQERRHRLGGRASGQRCELVLLGEAGFDDPAPFRPGAGDEVAQAVIALRTHDQIDGRRAPQDLGALRSPQPATVTIVSLPALRRASFTWRMRPRSE
jgi:hypothetical protein